MNRLVRLSRTSIGRKLLVAITGLLLGLFVIAHLMGNLLVFKGQEAFNAYADYLKGHPLLWVGRLGLLLVLLIHIYTALRLVCENREARNGRYVVDATVQASLASRHMLMTGLLVLAFVVYHLLHLTFGVIHSEHFTDLDTAGRPDVYSMVVRGFRVPWISGAYIVAMILLAFHLIHGVVSFFQTIGLHHESYNRPIRSAAVALVLIIFVGFCSIPLAVFSGYVNVTVGDSQP